MDLISRVSSNAKFIFQFPEEIKWNWDKVITNPGINYDDQTFKFIFDHYNKHYQAQNNKFKDFALQTFLNRIFNFYNNDKAYFLKKEFLKHIHWKHIRYYNNTKLPLGIILSNKDKFDFKNSEFIREHKDIITTSFIEDNLDLFDPYHYTFYYLPLNREIVKRLDSKVNWNKLSSCAKLDWTWEFIESNWDKLNKNRLNLNKGVYNKLIATKFNKIELC